MIRGRCNTAEAVSRSATVSPAFICSANERHHSLESNTRTYDNIVINKVSRHVS